MSRRRSFYVESSMQNNYERKPPRLQLTSTSVNLFVWQTRTTLCTNKRSNSLVIVGLIPLKMRVSAQFFAFVALSMGDGFQTAQKDSLIECTWGVARKTILSQEWEVHKQKLRPSSDATCGCETCVCASQFFKRWRDGQYCTERVACSIICNQYTAIT